MAVKRYEATVIEADTWQEHAEAEAELYAETRAAGLSLEIAQGWETTHTRMKVRIYRVGPG